MYAGPLPVRTGEIPGSRGVYSAPLPVLQSSVRSATGIAEACPSCGPAPHHDGLVGRRAEQARLRRLVDDAHRGQPRSLVVWAHAGQGKTALLRDAAAAAVERGAIVVWTAGTEFDTALAYAGLSTVFSPLLRRGWPSDPGDARALRSAMGVESTRATTLEVSVATLAALGEAGEAQPVLVVVDDAHWLDGASLEAFRFVAHRLVSERVALLFAARPGGAPCLRALDAESLGLDGLAEADAVELLASRGVRHDVGRLCWAACGGTPLALVEIARSLTRAQRTGRRPLPDPLPIGARLQDAFAARCHALAPDVRRLLAVAAVEGTGDLDVLQAVAGRLGLDLSDLGEAERHGLVTVQPGRLGWTHPLVRSSLHAAIEPAERRRIHAVLAEALDHDLHLDRVAWHLAAAATGCDDEAATHLSTVADNAQRRGAVRAAAQAYAAAARLFAQPSDRLECRYRAAEAWWMAGETERTIAGALAALNDAPGAELRARLHALAGQAETWWTGPAAAARRLEWAATTVADDRPDKAAVLLAHAITARLFAAEIEPALRQIPAARELAERSGDVAAMVAVNTMAGAALLVGGRAAEAEELLDPVRVIARSAVDAHIEGAAEFAQAVGWAAMVAGRWSEGEQLLGSVVRAAQERGMVGLAAFADCHLSELLWRTGRWTDAAVRLGQLEALAEASEQVAPREYLAAHQAVLEAGRGDATACRRYAARSLDNGERLGMGVMILRARHALGLLELGLGDAAAAADHLDAVAVATTLGGVRHPGVFRWQGDHVEALLAADRRGAALAAIERLRADADVSRCTWAMGVLARSEALAGIATDADERFGVALDAFEAINAPFEAARTLLHRARHRLAQRRVAEGGRDAAAARSLFLHLGARPWIERANALLNARSDERPGLAETLTGAELRVAVAVGRGATNRDAAARLYLSVKTVEFHLQNIYRKLQVRSRSQLTALVVADLG
jgi:DNA-binding CsgD family transcriptional regulator